MSTRTCSPTLRRKTSLKLNRCCVIGSHRSLVCCRAEYEMRYKVQWKRTARVSKIALVKWKVKDRVNTHLIDRVTRVSSYRGSNHCRSQWTHDSEVEQSQMHEGRYRPWNPQGRSAVRVDGRLHQATQQSSHGFEGHRRVVRRIAKQTESLTSPESHSLAWTDQMGHQLER